MAKNFNRNIVLCSGDESWPAGCQLRFCQGENLANTDRAVLGTLNPRETTDISVEMHSPTTPGVYQSQWRMCTATGMYFGGIFCFLSFSSSFVRI